MAIPALPETAPRIASARLLCDNEQNSLPSTVDMSKIENPDVTRVFDGYPDAMRVKMMRLRQLVLDTVSETEGVNSLEETLKWGEPSYLTKGGSTVRIELERKVRRTDTRYTSSATLRWSKRSKGSMGIHSRLRAKEPSCSAKLTSYRPAELKRLHRDSANISPGEAPALPGHVTP